MPTYDFFCDDCGPFEQRRSLAEAGDPMACPRCGEEARRVYSMPHTKRVPTGLSKAMDRAEKSVHEPEVVRRPAGGGSKGHGHGHAHRGRPWAVGH